MCRLTGYIDLDPQPGYDRRATGIAMRDTLTHGGPDDAGLYLDEDIALGHRRLSILDLSERGRQPIAWEQYVIVHNGEVYNFREVRAALEAEGYLFATDTDTEVILKAMHHWGREAVHRFRGMFAFAIWNRQTRRLLLCRDRMGVKPLYWYRKGGLFLFASELKAFHKHPGFEKTIDLNAVNVYLQQGYIPAPGSIYQEVRKLQPGHFLEIQADHLELQLEPYWSPLHAFEQPAWQFSDLAEAKAALKPQLLDSFQLRMVSDVPVGIFLSGGIDSSLVTALLQTESRQRLQTFTIGFEQQRLNEAPQAEAIARHLGTDHHSLICTEQDLLDLYPQLPEIYDEPFGDSSGLPTWLVSRMARERVTVSLSADGGDELFGGYTKYEMAYRFFPKFQKLAGRARQPLAWLARQVDPLQLERYAHFLPFFQNYTNLSNKYHKARFALSARDAEEFFHRSSVFVHEKQLRKLTGRFVPRFSLPLPQPEDRHLSRLGLIDLLTYLEGDILCKVDRATMRHGLEGREPLLDHQLAEWALRLPDSWKIHDGQSKYLLRQLLYDYLPPPLIDRPKQGFAIPIDDWLQAHFRDPLLALSEDTLFQQAFELRPRPLRRTIQDYLSRRRYVNPYFVWFLLMLYEWHRRWEE